MEKSPANTEGQKHMSDVAMARDFVEQIGGTDKAKLAIARAYNLLALLFPYEDDPKAQWTERRVRSFWGKEAAIVEFREMAELYEAAQVAEAQRAKMAQARKEHAAFIQKTARLRSLLEHRDPDFHGPEIERLGGVAGGVDRARIGGE